MNGREDASRPLYLELRALGLELSVEDDPDGGPLDHGIGAAGLRRLPGAREGSVRRRIERNAENLARVLLDGRDPGILAVRAEGNRPYRPGARRV